MNNIIDTYKLIVFWYLLNFSNYRNKKKIRPYNYFESLNEKCVLRIVNFF